MPRIPNSESFRIAWKNKGTKESTFTNCGGKLPRIELASDFKDDIRRAWPNKLLTARLFYAEAVRLGVLDESEASRGRDSAELERLLEENRSLGRFPTFESFTKWINRHQEVDQPI